MNLRMTVQEWIVLQAVLERVATLHSMPGDDALHAEQLRLRMRSEAGRALQAHEGDAGDSLASKWLDNQHRRVGAIRPPPLVDPQSPTEPVTLESLRKTLTAESDELPDIMEVATSVDESHLEAYFPPSEDEMQAPEYQAIWRIIECWKIAVPGVYSGVVPASSRHAMAILSSLRETLAPFVTEDDVDEEKPSECDESSEG